MALPAPSEDVDSPDHRRIIRDRRAIADSLARRGHGLTLVARQRTD